MTVSVFALVAGYINSLFAISSVNSQQNSGNIWNPGNSRFLCSSVSNCVTSAPWIAFERLHKSKVLDISRNNDYLLPKNVRRRYCGTAEQTGFYKIYTLLCIFFICTASEILKKQSVFL